MMILVLTILLTTLNLVAEEVAAHSCVVPGEGHRQKNLSSEATMTATPQSTRSPTMEVRNGMPFRWMEADRPQWSSMTRRILILILTGVLRFVS
jgi:hypothetical protein